MLRLNSRMLSYRCMPQIPTCSTINIKIFARPSNETSIFLLLDKGDPRFLGAFRKALALIQEIFKKYFTYQDEVISGYWIRR